MATRADRVGQQFGDYRLIRLLGSGSFGEVYLGEHLRERSLAAVKVLRAMPTADDWIPFKDEASSLLRLRHPNIVTLLEVGMTSDQTLFLVMDYTPGGTLRQRHPRSTRLPLDTIVTYVKQIAGALQYVHELGILHRDLKPENVLLGPNNDLLLSDFGLPLITPSVGTMAYAAPEQLQGQPCMASDQYALAVMIYEWLCGTCPFTGPAHEIARQHLHTAPPPLCEPASIISSEVEWVVLAALAKDPQRRFASVRAFAHALEQASHYRTEPARGTPLLPYRNQSNREAVAWRSPDGKWVASANDEGVYIGDATTGTTLFTYHSRISSALPVAWSPDGTYLAFGTETKLLVWSVIQASAMEMMEILKTESVEEEVMKIEWSPNSQYLCVWLTVEGSETFERASVWNVIAGKGYILDSWHTVFQWFRGIMEVVWSPDGSHLLAASRDGIVRVWDVVTGTELLEIRPQGYSEAIVRQLNPFAPSDPLSKPIWSPDGRRIAIKYGDELQIWDAITGSFLYTSHGEKDF